MSPKFVQTLLTLPKDFVSKPSVEGTTAFEYLSGRRDIAYVMDDDDLMWVLDDKHPDGGLVYVFQDHSSVVYKPRVQ
jgi:hypothetical protein